MGVAPSATFLDLPVRQAALAASGAGVMALGIPLSIAEFRDIDTYAAVAARGRACGSTGALCIHPAQVAAANRAFAPTTSELASARAVVHAWDEAGGSGASTWMGI